ncbi:MAG: ATP-binding cassette domain-containing protein [Planctomycetaceae bacterium]
MHVGRFLERCLLPREAQEAPVGPLSGGERYRGSLAKMLLRGGDVLVLDEPTNDLDLMALRGVEEALVAFEGAVLVVSHDRWFLDRGTKRILYLDGSGAGRHHPGDLSSLLEGLRDARERGDAGPERATREKPSETRKLTYSEQIALGALPAKFAVAEEELHARDARRADPAIHTAPPAQAREAAARRAEAAARVETLYAWWAELEAGLLSGAAATVTSRARIRDTSARGTRGR